MSLAELVSFNIRAIIYVHEMLHLIFELSMNRVYVSQVRAYSRDTSLT
jgi:hypothetical protein